MIEVTWTKALKRELDKLPEHIRIRFNNWVQMVELEGIRRTRERPGFHDEPLKGQRAGQRSVRLNRSYRAIYVERFGGLIELIEVIEVNKHDY